MKESQIQWVEQALRDDGHITRNQCLREYITRLSAIIFRLNENGYHIESSKVPIKTKWGKTYDFKYTVKHMPKKQVFINE